MTADAELSTARIGEASEPSTAAAPDQGSVYHVPGGIRDAVATAHPDTGALGSPTDTGSPGIETHDGRYRDALEDLHARLDQIAQLMTDDAHHDAGAQGGDASAPVETQVAALAERVRQADAVRRSQPQGALPNETESRLEASAAPIEDPAMQPETEIPPAVSALDQELQSLNVRLEQSLAAPAPANEVEPQSAQPAEPEHPGGAMPAPAAQTGNEPSIEAKLGDLLTQFSRAQEQFGRLETIEGHLLCMMDTMQTSRSDIDEVARKTAQETVRVFSTENDTAQAVDRLDAIRGELNALNDRARQMDERTVDTLDAMNDTLKTLAERVGVGAAGPQPAVAAPQPQVAEPQAQAPQQPQSDGHAVARTDQGSPQQAAGPSHTSPGADAGQAQTAQPQPQPRADLGADIPDYQPIAAEAPASVQEPTSQAAPGDAGADAHEPVEAQRLANEDDFIASARRAAQAAAAQAHEAPERKSFFSRFKRKTQQAPAVRPMPTGESRTSRSLLVFAAVFLLIVSAVLLYGRLKTKDRPVAETPQQSLPAPAAPVVETPPLASEPVPDTPSPEAEPPAAEPANPSGRTGEARKRSLVTDTPPKVNRQSKGRFAVAMPEVDKTYADAAPARPTDAKVDRGAKVAALSAAPSPAKPTRRKTHVETPLPGLTVQIVEPTKDRPTDDRVARAHIGAAEPVTPGARSIPMPPAGVGPLSLRMAASKGDAAAQFKVATRFAQGKGVDRNFVEAARWYKRAAALGLAPAQYRLGVFYERGRGLDKDLAQARLWYRRAAEQGNIKAMHNLAVTYTSRNVRGPDYATAAQWFEKAAQHGLSDSQFNLGILFQNGLGVRKSLAEAYRWFALAAAGGDQEAEKRLKSLKVQILPDTLKRIEHAVRNWKAKPSKKAANSVSTKSDSQRNAKQSGNATVARVQFLLNKLGYQAGTPDGRLGPRTQAAIRAFEKRSGLVTTGRVNDKLIARLESLAG